MRCALLVCLVLPSVSLAAPSLQHQGRLLDLAGGPLDGTHDLGITLWTDGDSTDAASRLWTANYTAQVADGYYTVALETADNGDELDAAWFADDVWIGVSVDGAAELQPRQALTTVPAALSADTTRRVRVATASGACENGEIVWDPSRVNLAVCNEGEWNNVGPTVITIRDGARSWSDGGYAASCNEYINPGNGRLYQGSVGDGVYRIDPDGDGSVAPFDVHCDMTTEGGGWTLLGTIAGGDADRWNTQFGFWSDANTLGQATTPHEADLKSEAWLHLDITESEVMFERWHSGEIKDQSVLNNSCLHGQDRFVDLFATNDTGLRCGRSNVRTLRTANEGVGTNYGAGQSNGLGGVDTNGFCWNGGDNNSNTFRGHVGWNQSAYSTCVAAGHLGYIGVWQVGSPQYENKDITGTNWLFGTSVSLTSVSLYAR